MSYDEKQKELKKVRSAVSFVFKFILRRPKIIPLNLGNLSESMISDMKKCCTFIILCFTPRTLRSIVIHIAAQQV